jgi:hypothetical protein
VITHHDDVFALPGRLQFGGWLGLSILAALAIFLYRTALSTWAPAAPE